MHASSLTIAHSCRYPVTTDGTDTWFQTWISTVIVRNLRDPATWVMKVGLRNSRVSKLPVGETCMILQSLVLSQYQHVTDGRTDMPPMPLFHDLLLSPISQHSAWGEITSHNPLHWSMTKCDQFITPNVDHCWP